MPLGIHYDIKIYVPIDTVMLVVHSWTAGLIRIAAYANIFERRCFVRQNGNSFDDLSMTQAGYTIGPVASHMSTSNLAQSSLELNCASNSL